MGAGGRRECEPRRARERVSLGACVPHVTPICHVDVEIPLNIVGECPEQVGFEGDV